MVHTNAINILYSAKQDGIEIILNNGQLQVKFPKNRTINSELLEAIKTNKTSIIEFLRSHEKIQLNGNGISKAARSSLSKFPLSFSQERLWFIDQLEGSTQYHIPVVLRLNGQVNKEALSRSLQSIVQRHEILRTTIGEEEGNAYQQIQDGANWQLELLERSDLAGDADGLTRFLDKLLVKPFDLRKDHLFRATLISLNLHEHILAISMHHIVSDGWSIGILLKELENFYEAYLQGKTPALEPLDTQYADYAVWQRAHLAGEFLERKLEYWKEKLDGLVPLSLPADYRRPPVQSTKGALISFTIDKNVSERLEQLSQIEGTTLYMTMLAAFKALLFHYTSQQDICVGSPAAGRQQHQVQDLVGLFVNTLTLRSEVRKEASFKELLQQVKRTTLEAYDHQEVPFEKVVEVTVRERDMSRHPLFQLMFILENTFDATKVRLGDIVPVLEPLLHNTSKFDLTFGLTRNDDGMKGNVEYCTDLYREATVSAMIRHYQELLNSIVANPNEQIGKLSLLSGAEKDQILSVFNATEVSYPKKETVISLFEQQVKQSPGKVAVIFGEDQITFEDLDLRANQLAFYLKKKGITPGSNIGLLSYRGLDMIVGMLGILKAGGVYVPFNTEYPVERLKYIIEDARITHIVYTSDDVRSSFDLGDFEYIDARASANSEGQSIAIDTDADSPVYIMYTSGTTGRPRGITISNKNIVKLVYDAGDIAVHPEDTVLQWSNYAFDGSVYDIYSSLLKGASLCLIKNDWASDVFHLSKVIREKEVSVCFITTALFNTFIDIDPDALKSLRKILFGGEMVSSSHVRKAFSILGPSKMVHVYGPTETTVYATWYPIDQIGEDTIVPIGRPLSNTKLLVLNESGQLVPVGVPGELYIGGDGVSLGYLNEPVLMEQKFLPDLFFNKDGKLYRTGDLGKWLPDGNIEFIGRVDEQVKIRGYRIELGEIESVLQKNVHVRQTAVLAKPDVTGTKQLIGYVVAEEGFRREDIVSFLKDKLPEYMIPQQWVILKQLPLTANGKIDRKALPEPEKIEGENIFVAPQTETEKILAKIWQDLLNIERVSIHDNFFQLGGHSLLAMRMKGFMRSHFDVELSVKDLFLHPTIGSLALHLGARRKGLQLPSIVRQERPSFIPLSFSQQRLWFIDRLEGSSQYHIPLVLRLRGKVNSEALLFSLQSIVDRHEVLRTVIVEEEGGPGQVITERKEAWQLHLEDGSRFRDDGKGLDKYLDELINRPFDLSKDYMLRAALVSLDSEDHVLVVTMHHIASDGWSMSVFVREFTEAYGSYIEGRPSHLPPLEIQYADYALWQRKYLGGEVLDEKIRYWKEKLSGVEPLQLSTDYVRPAVQSTKGALLSFTLDGELKGGLQHLSTQQGTTLFMTLLAAFKVLLHKYSGQEDICVGTVISERGQRELEALIGFFVNTLALRSQVNSGESFTDFLRQVRSTTLEGYEHQEAPFERVVQAVVKERDMSRNPLFQVMFMLQNVPEFNKVTLGDIELTNVDVSHQTAKFDLIFGLAETPDGITGGVEYSTDLFQEATILKLIGHYKTLLHAIIEKPATSISGLTILTSNEQEELLIKFNQTATSYPGDKTITQLFEEQALKTPEAVALVFGKEQLSYKELNLRANKLSHYLISKGVVAETLVPLCIERSVNLIVGILAILKAGGAYVPIDPLYPFQRIEYMLDDIDASIIVCDRHNHLEVFSERSLDVVIVDADVQITAQAQHNPQIKVLPSNLAYVIYTSGSTGRPKGVMVEHKNVVSLVKSVDYVSLTAREVLLSTGSPSFDATTFEFWSMLLNGGQLVLCSEHTLLDSKALKDEIAKRHVTIMWCTSSWFNSLVDTDLSIFQGVRTILVGGEKLSERHIVEFREKFPNTKVLNGYGPTENTTFSLTHHVTSDEKPIPIGRPLNNRTAYIVNSTFQLSPTGVIGEICVGGEGLSRGYLNNAALTEERFIINPFGKDPGEKMYRTGDLGKWLPDGSIQYLGRKDDQVKIRGYRIEPGEIETVLLSSGFIKEAAVVIKEHAPGDKHLVAYVVPDENFDKELALASIRTKLPEYMVPGKWVTLEQMPLTSNGKVDKLALPEVEALEEHHEYIAPQSEGEKIMAGIWKELLQLQEVGVKDNFFELGGHSLVVLQLVDRVRKMGIEFNANDFFAYQTIEQQSNFINTSLRLLQTASEGKFVMPIQTKGNNIPVFAFPEFVLYSKIGNHITKNQPFYTIEMSPYKKEEEVVRHYLSEIRKARPHGPYCLVGYCKWGSVAVEMAQKLIAEGEEVPVIVLIEYYSIKAMLPRSSTRFIGPKTKFLYDNLKKNVPLKRKSKFLLMEAFYVFRFFYKKIVRIFKKDVPLPVKTYDGKVVLIRASQTYGVKDDPYMGWSETFTGDVESYMIDGEHLGIFLEPGAHDIAEKLNMVLEKVNRSYKRKKAPVAAVDQRGSKLSVSD